MGFDLTTFLAQLVNLFLLVWLLKHFLYRPVLNVIERRQQRIANDIRQAEEQLSEAEKAKSSLQKEQDKFDKERQKRLDDLEHDIQYQKAQMLKELELDYITRRQKLQDSLNQSWQTAENTIQQMIGKEFISLSQKILAEWSSQDLTDQMLTLFAKKVSSLSTKKREELAKLMTKQKIIQINTSSTFNKKQQNVIRSILTQNLTLPAKTKLQFKKHPDLLLGLEMRIDKFILDWNLNTYLDEMNQNLKRKIADLIVPTQRKADK